MKKLILVGASGYGRDIAERVMLLPGFNQDFTIKGFLVHKKEYLHSLDEYPNYPPVIGLVDDYIIEDDDVFLCTLGDVMQKKTIISLLKQRGAKFFTFVHPEAAVSPDAIIGEGTIVLEKASIGSGAKIGSFCLIQISSIIAHDNVVGDYSRIDCNVVCVGDVLVGEGVTIHTSAVINHGVRIEDNATVGALSFVVRSVKAGTTVCGNPATRLKY